MRVKEEKEKIKERKEEWQSFIIIDDKRNENAPERWKNIVEEVKAGRGNNLADFEKVVKMRHRKTYL